MKPFVAVKFTDGSHEIIPREWMVSDATCLYPPHKNINKDFIICNMVPDEDWKCYKIKILASASMCYLFLINICTVSIFVNS